VDGLSKYADLIRFYWFQTRICTKADMPPDQLPFAEYGGAQYAVGGRQRFGCSDIDSWGCKEIGTMNEGDGVVIFPSTRAATIPAAFCCGSVPILAERHVSMYRLDPH